MKIDKLVAVTGMSGIYKVIANRNNGLIVENLDTGKRTFASSRIHQFTPLETVGIYTNDGDTQDIKDVFQTMLDKIDELPPVDPNAGNNTLFEYFAQILPNYDQEKVKSGDVKKVIKWFGFLNERGLLTATDTEGEEEE